MYKLSSWTQPVRGPHPTPMNQILSAVKRARGTIKPLPSMPSMMLAMDKPSSVLGLLKLDTWHRSVDGINQHKLVKPDREIVHICYVKSMHQ